MSPQPLQILLLMQLRIRAAFLMMELSPICVLSSCCWCTTEPWEEHCLLLLSILINLHDAHRFRGTVRPVLGRIARDGCRMQVLSRVTSDYEMASVLWNSSNTPEPHLTAKMFCLREEEALRGRQQASVSPRSRWCCKQLCTIYIVQYLVLRASSHLISDFMIETY